MKKIFYLLFLFCFSFVLCSCNDTRIADIEGVVWRDDAFHIEASSEEINSFDNYSRMIINDKQYNCILSLENNAFNIMIYDENYKLTSFYGDEQSFICGHYSDLVKEQGKEYIYSLEIRLLSENQYYDYCVNNNINYPESMTLYGYAA